MWPDIPRRTVSCPNTPAKALAAYTFPALQCGVGSPDLDPITRLPDLSVIATATNTVLATISVGEAPLGVEITPDGAFAYVANFGGASVSVIDTATRTVTATIPVRLTDITTITDVGGEHHP